MAYQEILEEQRQGETDEDVIKKVTPEGNKIIIEYEFEEGMTEMDAIIASKFMANVWGEKVELTPEEEEYFRTQTGGYEGDEDVNEDDVIDLGDILSE